MFLTLGKVTSTALKGARVVKEMHVLATLEATQSIVCPASILGLVILGGEWDVLETRLEL